MRKLTELELKARVGKRGDPVVVVVAQKRQRFAEELVRAVSAMPHDVKSRVEAVAIDVDDEPRLCDELRVRRVPELLVFVDGKLVQRTEGVLDPTEAASFVEDALARA